MELGPRQKQWIKDLRSGEFKQAKGSLHKTNGKDSFCCLGLVARRSGIFEAVRQNWQFSYDKKYGVLPDEIRSWVGLYSGSGTATPDSKRHSLTTLNDSGDTFDDIADVLEKYPEDYFEESK